MTERGRILESTLQSVDDAEDWCWTWPGGRVPGGGVAQDQHGGAGDGRERRGAREPLQRPQEGALRGFHGRDHLTVTVGDQGNGFDLASLPDPLAEENLLHQSGRGILLIRAFVDEFLRAAAESGGNRSEAGEVSDARIVAQQELIE